MSRHADADADTDENENVDESTTAPAVPTEFEAFKEAYPKRAGGQPWTKALKSIRARLKEGSQWPDFLEGAKRYADFCDSTDLTGTQFVLQAATFCGPEKHYLEPWQPPRTKGERLQDKNINAGQAFLGSANGR